MPQTTGSRSLPVVPLLGWLGVFLAGLVLAFSWLVPWPAGVFWGAVLVGLAALVAVTAEAFRASRARGVSIGNALWRSFKSGLAFLRDFL